MSKLELTICDDCCEEVYIDDVGDLFDDEKGANPHPDNCFEFECPSCSTTVDSEGELCEDCERDEEDDDGS